MNPSGHAVTDLLQAWRKGDRAALDSLIHLVYPELHRIAQRHMAKQLPGNTLQTTALINEAYIRLVGKQGTDWQSRYHFFGVCGKIIRGVLIDHYRRRRKVSLDEDGLIAPERHVDLLALDEALSRLEVFDSRKSQIVELRFFSGMTEEEVAEVLNLTLITVKREWKRARAWLYRELTEA